MQRVVEHNELHMEIIVNPKVSPSVGIFPQASYSEWI